MLSSFTIGVGKLFVFVLDEINNTKCLTLIKFTDCKVVIHGFLMLEKQFCLENILKINLSIVLANQLGRFLSDSKHYGVANHQSSKQSQTKIGIF